MRSAPTLNEAQLGRWLTVVDRQAWKAHTIDPFSSEVRRDYRRGPVIVFTSKLGEGEDFVPLLEFEPSPLEVRAAAVNMGGLIWCFHGPLFHPHLNRSRPRDQRQAMHLLVSIRAHLDDRDYWVDHIKAHLRLLRRDAAQAGSRGDRATASKYLADLAEGLKALAKGAQSDRSYWAASFALTLRALEAAAYRAHLTRRVRPVSQHTHAPRPLYARPRPPTAPLAPPVA